MYCSTLIRTCKNKLTVHNTLEVGCSLGNGEKEAWCPTFFTLSFLLLLFFCRHTRHQATPTRRTERPTANTAPPPAKIRTRSPLSSPSPVAVETVGGGEGVMSNVSLTAVSGTPPTSIWSWEWRQKTNLCLNGHKRYWIAVFLSNHYVPWYAKSTPLSLTKFSTVIHLRPVHQVVVSRNQYAWS